MPESVYVRKSVKCVLAAVALLIVAGCYGVRNAPQDHPVPAPLVVPTSPDRLWPAIVEVVGDYHLAVQTMDRESGLLQTGPMRSASVVYWDCGEIEGYDGKIKSHLQDTIFVKFTLTATPVGADSTRVRVVASPSDCTSRGTIEQEMAQKIVAHWKERG
jgi:hypothetical protein